MHAEGFTLVCFAVLLTACATTPPFTVCGAPVRGNVLRGEVHVLSPAEIEAAVGAMRADLPQIRSQQLTRIDVISRNEIFLSYRQPGEYYSVPHVVKRVGGHWHYTGHIIVGLSD